MNEDTTSADFDHAVSSAMSRITRFVAPVGTPANELLDPLTSLSSRGKRLRARLLVMAHEAAGGGRRDAAVRVAAALELFQVAALVHDDVLDDSDTRRGLPSTHRVIQGVHAESHWRGDSARFGTSSAILAGDLALMACMSELVGALVGVDAEVAAAVGDRFSHMASVCTAGQYLDLRLAAQSLESLPNAREDILEVMRAKTASYTTVGPLALGAALAGGPRHTVDQWAAIGLPLGVAFQLRDDVLGVIGSEAETGKPAGDDLREGKPTLLLAHALAHSDAAGRELIADAVGGDAQSVAAAVSVLVRSGAIDAAETEITRLANEARTLLESVPMDALHRERLFTFFDATTNRVF